MIVELLIALGGIFLLMVIMMPKFAPQKDENNCSESLDHSTESTNVTGNKIKVSAKEVVKKWGAISDKVPLDIWIEAQNALESKCAHIYMDEVMYSELCMEYANYSKREQSLQETAILNNRGIQFENKGRIADAIATYEACIAFQYPAPHAYERLMILDRKQRNYADEIRVIELAIKVFCDENERRANMAKAMYPDLADEIDHALEMNTDLYNIDGRNIFHQYKIFPYFDRLAKAKKLLSNYQRKMNPGSICKKSGNPQSQITTE